MSVGRRSNSRVYRLVRRSTRAGSAGPTLDPSQQAVVDTRAARCWCWPGRAPARPPTLVESVVDRIERRGVAPGPDPGADLLPQGGRRSAGRGSPPGWAGPTVTPMVMTFHAFCYALVRRFADRVEPSRRPAPPLRLLTGPEQEFRVRETLLGSLETRRVDLAGLVWRGAFRTRAFAAEVRAVLAKARQLGHGPRRRHRRRRGRRPPGVGRRSGSSSTSTSTCSTPSGCSTTPSSCTAAGSCSPTRSRRRTAGARSTAVFVDEYQDTDPAQVRLLQAIAGDGRDVVVVGDPDQSIYAFRGAEARGILDFPDRFRTADGDAGAGPAPWATTRRFGPALLAASRNIAGRLGLPRALPAGSVRRLPAARAGAGPAARLGGGLHLHHGRAPRPSTSPRSCAAPTCATAWPGTTMAVLVRSGRAMIPGLTRALVAAGVPVEVAGDEIPLAADPAVRPLLLGLQVAARGARHRPRTRPRCCSPRRWAGWTAWPYAGSAGRCGEAERAELAGTALPRPSAELIGLALRHPDRLAECARPGPEVEAAPRLADLLARCGAASGPAAPPRRRCGCSGPAPTGRTGCAEQAARRRRGWAAGPTGTWTPSARCSTSPPAPRRSRGRAA